MSRRKNSSRLLGWLNATFWSLAALVWTLVILKHFEPRPAEPQTDPLHITGSRERVPDSVLPEAPPVNHRGKQVGIRPTIAIIIDDFGPAWDQTIVNGFLRLPFDVTLSIIPGNPTSIDIAGRAHRAGKEVFIHLPMEPTEPVALGERDMVFTGTSREKLHAILDRVTSEIPSAVGLNNHMGSKATGDSRLMNALSQELESRGLLFVDSRTSEHSVALSEMKQAGVPALGRDVFLDVESDSASVTARLRELAGIARRRGYAIGIGHVRRNTLAALKVALPQLEREGIRFLAAGKAVRENAEEREVAVGKSDH